MSIFNFFCNKDRGINNQFQFLCGYKYVPKDGLCIHIQKKLSRRRAFFNVFICNQFSFSLYSRGVIPVCFLKYLPKNDGLGKFNSSDI